MSVQSCIEALIQNLPGDTAVISPGSRNAPILFALNHLKRNCYSIIDERSAGFMALGMAKHTRQPVILNCTSGTASLNYYPAIAEAFYARVPLIVITADRPPEHIDAWDGQAIRQKNVYRNHIRGEFQTPDSFDDESAFTAIAQQVVKCLQSEIPGPVHINVPIREPFYDMSPSDTSSNTEVNFPLVSKIDFSLSSIAAGANVSFDHKKVLVFNGMDDGEGITITSDKAVILSDITSSKQSNVSYWDAMLFSSLSKQGGMDALKVLSPDILITTGTTIVSKGLKHLLKIHKPEAHFHITNYDEVGDMFGSQPQLLNPSEIQSSLSDSAISIEGSYLTAWKNMTELFQSKFSQLDWLGYHEFSIVNFILEKLKSGTILHLSNSMPVRYASFLMNDKRADNTVFANRGTSGIDGCTSTALGNALVTDKNVLLITGDLAFFYDINAFFNQHLPQNLKVIILNNRGGGIFNLIKGPENMGESRKLQSTPHFLNASALCTHFGITHFAAKDIGSFRSCYNQFEAYKGAAVLELTIREEENQKAFDEFMNL
ncbi:MAG: 2-succinyl-5-enolpyruvyl-6-hydroxy-3-cyclohexene-1-carboxylic-acid synthase [Bacteroidetes bacterium]|nr:2-succinyl-5-enolpyruvyl-6-hydroxy-3-cyclohexene-1-carboxylic-acid synthase [Bacteroidota bacterium]